MRFDFAAPSASDTGNRSANTARLLNFYREPVGDGEFWLRSVPGTEPVASLSGVFCRAMAEIEDVIYVAHGGQLWSVTSSGVTTPLGSITDSPDTTISGNNGNVVVAAGGDYYVWDATALSRPSLGAFPGAGSVSFFGQLTVVTESNGRRLTWSGLADAKTFSGSFATAETRDDKILRGLAVGSSFWVFKETSIEEWYQTDTGIAYTPGSTMDIGLKSYRLVAKVRGGVFFIASDDVPYLDRQPLMNAAVQTAIKDGDIVGVTSFDHRGNIFCAILFSDRPAWLFNAKTGEWSERAEGNDLGAWTARACVEMKGSFYVCNDIGQVSRLASVYADGDQPLIRRCVSRTLEAEGQRFKVPKVEVRARTGFYDDEPQMQFRMSGDFGMTWMQPRYIGLGKRGDYTKQLTFRRFGQFRQATAEVTVSDPVDVTIAATVFA